MTIRDPFQGYDQWKTASPYDNDPDPIEEAEAFIKKHLYSNDEDLQRAATIIEYLLKEIPV